MITTLYQIFGLITGMLVISTAIGQVLAFKYGKSSVVNNLNTRIYAWWAMVAVIASSFLLGEYGVIFLFLFLSGYALYEFIRVLPRNPLPLLVLLITFCIILPLQYFFILMHWYGMFAVFIPVYGFLLLSLFLSFFGGTADYLTRLATLQCGVMMTVYCISCVPALFVIEFESVRQNQQLIVWLLLVVQLSDVLQYVCGKLWGKHKIAPSLSPSKTIEGFVGGVLLACLIGMMLSSITPFTDYQAFGIALLVTLSGFVGGLVMSSMKRNLGIKDWGNLISGHGGLWDRLDSVCFSAPLYFHVVYYFWG